MRPVTAEEIEQIAAGLAKNASPRLRTLLVKRKGGVHPATTTLPPVTVTASPPSSGGGWGLPPTSGGGAGVGPPPIVSIPPTSSGGLYNDGKHNVDDRDFTCKDTHNNPGDLMHKDSSGNYVLNTYDTEQDGRDALARNMDGSIYYNMDISKMGAVYAPDSADPGQAERWTTNVENYMSEYGYSTAGSTNPANMGDAEFNVFLDAITNAEGNTNMGNLSGN